MTAGWRSGSTDAHLVDATWPSCRPVSARDGGPRVHEVVGRSPGQRLYRKRRVVATGRRHTRRSENAEIRDFVRKAPAVHHRACWVVAHPRTAVRMKAEVAGAGGCAPGARSTGLAEPLLRPGVAVGCTSSFILAPIERDPNDRHAHRILYHRIEVEVVRFVGERFNGVAD